jgi:hypothetical protein
VPDHRRGADRPTALRRSPNLKALRELEIVAYNKETEDFDETIYEPLLEELKRKSKPA